MMKSSTPYWWWFDGHQHSKRSPWIQPALAELDHRTQAILKLIEEDADSFAQRAEMYYKRRPQLITMIEQLYRTQRSLIERYDQTKTDSATPAHDRLLLPTCSSPFFFSAKKQLGSDKPLGSMDFKFYGYPETNCNHDVDGELEDTTESEVDDPEEVEEVLDDNDQIKENTIDKLREEIEKLREENRIQKEQLIQKDEEKRDVIRQLSLAVYLLKDDKAATARPKKSCGESGDGIEFTNKKSLFDFDCLKGSFLRKLFGGLHFSG